MVTAEFLALAIPVPFLLVVLLSLCIPKKYSRNLGYLGSAAGLVTLLIVLFLLGERFVAEIAWFTVPGLTFQYTVWLDTLSLLLAGVVGGIGSFVFLYSTGYLEKHEDLKRYYFLLGIFAVAMLGVVLTADLFQLFFFWELVGVSSFLLIGFWQHKESAVRAAKKAFYTIIFGDAFFLAGIFLLWLQYETLSIPGILEALQMNTFTFLAGIGIIIGSISKSAQFPLHDWLPDAMEGPTPVSAFLHSATMVKAGLFVIARFLPLLVLVGLSPWLIAIAVITILISACMALVENDIKRVLAYSTINQLGFILLALGVGALTAGMFHLLTHSIFKALLFFSAGIAIHVAGTQDIRKMNLKFGMNSFTIFTGAGVLALAGLVPFSGFFSKEAIFEGIHHAHAPELLFFFGLAILLSSAYIFRWVFLMFRKSGKKVHANWEMSLTLPILGTLAVVTGGFFWMFFGWWGQEPPHIFGLTAVVSTLLVLFGGGLTFFMFFTRTLKLPWLSETQMADVFRRRFFIPEIYDGIGRATWKVGHFFSWVDGAVVDLFVRDMSLVTLHFSSYLKRAQSGHVPAYVTALILGFALLTLIMGVFG